SKGVTIGFIAGFEKESGDWLYDNMGGKQEDWSSFKIGVFSRSAFTIASEVSITYRNEDDLRIYTTVGIGAIFKQETDVYQQQAFYGGNYVPAAQGTQVPDNSTKLTGYYSPFGMRFGGNLGGFIELGIGYKGMLNGGISYMFKSHKISKVKKPDKLMEYDN
ncbi:MAG: hypothetical protein ACHQD8_00660, partial [Chitinophagales bacterium]